jgi:protein tyrosine/serine phosphatase
VSLITDGGDRKANERRYKHFTDIGEFYLHLVRQKEFLELIIEALDVIAEPRNHPLLFHCSAGKDRTGILTAILLNILDVTDEDIINDYSLSASYMEVLLNRMKSESQMAEDSKSLPDYFWKAAPESMAAFLSFLSKEYGSVRGYLKAKGAELSLFERLEKALLI